jgi:DNA recombination protein RmuC
MLAAVLAIVAALMSVVVFVLWRGKAALEDSMRQALTARATAEATLAQIEQDYQNARDDAATAKRALSLAEKNEALALQKVEAAEIRLRDFEQLKTQFEQYAKAAALTTGQELSTKLLADAQREREAAQKQQAVERETTYKQFEQFSKLANEQFVERQRELAITLGKVQGQVNVSSDQLSTLVRAMQNPIGAGAEGEIVMSNILQQHGFTPGVDYELQVHLAADEGSLRPDCVIYLPHQHAIIVDSKASQHIFALFRAEGTPEFDAAFKEIQSSMRAHAKALGGKAYQDNLRKLKNRNGQPITRTTLVMFVPNDEVVTRLMQKDPNLMQYMREHDIVLAGPVTLSGIFLTARALVREAKQMDEHHAILELTSELMADLIAALGHAEDVMKGIRGSANAYDKFAGSMNRGVMARLKRLAAKGVRPAKNKQLPGSLPRYEIIKQDEVLQGEADEVVEVLSLPKEDAA